MVRGFALTELAVVLVLRTHGPAWRSAPSRLLGMDDAGRFHCCALVAFHRQNRLVFGFVPLSGVYCWRSLLQSRSSIFWLQRPPSDDFSSCFGAEIRVRIPEYSDVRGMPAICCRSIPGPLFSFICHRQGDDAATLLTSIHRHLNIIGVAGRQLADEFHRSTAELTAQRKCPAADDRLRVFRQRHRVALQTASCHEIHSIDQAL